MHAPEHLREAFAALVAKDWEEYDAILADTPMSDHDLLKALSDCTDSMPNGLCQALDLPLSSTYARGVGTYASVQVSRLAEMHYVPCKNGRYADASHVVTSQWWIDLASRMVDGPPVICGNHAEAVVLLGRLARGYQLEDHVPDWPKHLNELNPRWAKRIDTFGGKCDDAWATPVPELPPDSAAPDERYLIGRAKTRLACLRMGRRFIEVYRAGRWVPEGDPRW